MGFKLFEINQKYLRVIIKVAIRIAIMRLKKRNHRIISKSETYIPPYCAWLNEIYKL